MKCKTSKNESQLLCINPKTGIEVAQYKSATPSYEWLNKLIESNKDKDLYYILTNNENRNSITRNGGKNHFWSDTLNVTMPEVIFNQINEGNFTYITKEIQKYSMWLFKRRLNFLTSEENSFYFKQENVTICTERFLGSLNTSKHHLYSVNLHSKRIVKGKFINLFEDRLAKKKIKDALRAEKAESIDKENMNYYNSLNDRKQTELKIRNEIDNED